jgi:hypothetical protein
MLKMNIFRMNSERRLKEKKRHDKRKKEEIIFFFFFCKRSYFIEFRTFIELIKAFMEFLNQNLNDQIWIFKLQFFRISVSMFIR